jgi:long-chain acyl-CoA synthetase
METNLARLAEATLNRLGDHPSLFFEGEWHRSGTLHERATRVATGLVDLGVRPGERVVVLMANCPEVGIVYTAAWRAGGVVTPVVFLVTAPELEYIVVDSGAVAVITSPELLAKVTEATAAHPVRVVVVGTPDFAALEAYPPLSIVDRSGTDLAALMYTGGTTGRSKGVPLSHANLAHAGGASRSVSHIPGLVRGQTGLPLSHAFGLLVTVGALHAPEAGSSVLQRWFEPASFLRLAVEHRTQVAAMVPSMLVMLLSQPLEEYDLSEFRFVFSGGAPLAQAAAIQFQRRVPSAKVLEGYGCTETGGTLTSSPPFAARPGTVGRPVPDVELRVLDLDGQPVEPGQDGEVVVRGPNVMTGYWGGAALADGWFHTGDVGRLDADGFLTIVDRMKDLIIRGGFNVYPRDVEDALAQHPDVSMVAVVGRPDERLGEEVVAFVARNDGATVTGEELMAFAKTRLGATKYPREIRFMDRIPLTSVGKLDRKRLRAGLRAEERV